MLDVEFVLSPGENLSFVCEEQERGFASFPRNSCSTALVWNKLPFPFATLSKSVAALCRRAFVRIKASKISRQERIKNVFWFGWDWLIKLIKHLIKKIKLSLLCSAFHKMLDVALALTPEENLSIIYFILTYSHYIFNYYNCVLFIKY